MGGKISEAFYTRSLAHNSGCINIYEFRHFREITDLKREPVIVFKVLKFNIKLMLLVGGTNISDHCSLVKY